MDSSGEPMSAFSRGVLLMTLIVMAYISCASAQSPSEVDHRAETLATVLQFREFELQQEGKDGKPWCDSALTELRATPVPFRQPTFQTDDPDDPRFAAYQKCLDYAWTDSYVESWQMLATIRALGDRGFQVYRLPAGPRTPATEVVYAEVSEGAVTRNTGYSAVDVARCKIDGGVSTDPPDAYVAGRRGSIPILHGLFPFREGEALLHLHDGAVMELYFLNQSGAFDLACRWRAKPP
jgi:hypothetical protein